MRIERRTIVAVLLLSLLVGSVGCSERNTSDDQLQQSARDSTQEHTSRLDMDSSESEGLELTRAVPVSPAGLTRIPTYNTGAGPLFLRLPERYRVRVDSGYDADMIFIYREDDPLVAGDISQAPLAIARLTISDSAVVLDAPGIAGPSIRSRVNGVPVEYSYRREQVPGEGTYHSYEGELRHFFASRDPDRSLNNLHLHLYAGGTDSLGLRTLLEALTTLSFRP